VVASPYGQACPACGTLNAPAGGFCVNCGRDLTPATAVAGPALQAPVGGGSLAFLQDPAFWEDVRVRARRQVIPLGGVALVSFLDYQLHGQVPVALLIFAAGVAFTLFFREAIAWATEKLNLAQLGVWVQPLFISVPAALFFFLRGKGSHETFTTLDQGTRSSGISSAQGLLIAVLIVALPLVLTRVLPGLDPSLRGLYELRDRYIPAVARPFAMIAVSLIVTFGLIHGNLADVKILFGQTADKAGLPTFGDALLAAVLNVLIGFAFLRQPRLPAAAHT